MTDERLTLLPDGSLRVRLERPVPKADMTAQGHVTLRQPVMRDYMEMEDPFQLIYGTTGHTESCDRALLQAWVERLVIDHDVLILLARGTLTDAMALEAAVKRFFRTARETLSPAPPPSPTPHPSPSPTPAVSPAG